MPRPSFAANLPHTPGVYLMRDAKADIIYIGKARDLKKRVSSYFSPKKLASEPTAKTTTLVSEIRHIDYVPTASEREALVLERKLILDHQPVFNVMWKDDKSYPYIALTMGEDFPRLFLTRTRKRDGTSYFGPYPSVSGVRSLLKWAWRKKLFPLRPCHYEFTEKSPLPYSKVRHCLYLHTGQCPAPCIGNISRKAYRPRADRAQWFFEGRRDRLIKTWTQEMKNLSKNMKYEEAATLRDHLDTLVHMEEQVTIRQLSQEELDLRISRSRAVQDLMKALELPKPPAVIECFDISHFQGEEKVASMVRFVNGKPDKSNYRKYIIKTVANIDDFKSMAEVVGRRYRRLKNENREYPDLIVIDGGKGQLSFALKALKEEKIPAVPIAALAKEEEEIFLPSSSESLRLPKDSPALLLLRHIRDEAHRFAISFHRQRKRVKLKNEFDQH